MVAAAELLGALDSDQVAGLLDHADQGGVPPRVLADPAQVALGHVPADPAEVHPGLDLGDGPGQALGVGRFDLEDVEGQPLGALGTDPGQPPELVDQVLDQGLRTSPQSPRPGGSPMPWVMPPSRSAARSLALRRPSLTADQVAEHLDVVGVERVRVDRDRLHRLVALDPGRHHAAAGRPLDDLLGQLGLGVLHLALHLLQLLEHLVEVETTLGMPIAAVPSSCPGPPPA